MLECRVGEQEEKERPTLTEFDRVREELEKQRRQSDRMHEDLSRVKAELDERASRLEADEQAWRELTQDGDAAELLRRVEEQTASLLEAQQILEVDREELAALRRQHETQLAEQAETLERLYRQFQQRRTELESQFLGESIDSYQEPAPVSGQSSQPTDEDEADDDDAAPAYGSAVSDRADSGSDPDDEVEPQRELTTFESANLVNEQARTNARAATVTASAEEDPSIEEYMAALMHRVRGGAPVEPVIAPPVKRNRKSDAPPPEMSQADSNAEAPIVVKPVVDMPTVPAELTRRAAPREITDLSAMRAVANSYARTAIGTHGKKRLSNRVTAAAAAGMGCMLAAAAALLLVPADAGVLWTAAMGGIVAGVYWLYDAGKAWKQLRKAEAKDADALQSNG